MRKINLYQIKIANKISTICDENIKTYKTNKKDKSRFPCITDFFIKDLFEKEILSIYFESTRKKLILLKKLDYINKELAQSYIKKNITNQQAYLNQKHEIQQELMETIILQTQVNIADKYYYNLITYQEAKDKLENILPYAIHLHGNIMLKYELISNEMYDEYFGKHPVIKYQDTSASNEASNQNKSKNNTKLSTSSEPYKVKKIEEFLKED